MELCNLFLQLVLNFRLEDELYECDYMKKDLNPSEFRGLQNIEYFNFEEDYIEQNVRCIPMIVRFKMDAACIKLKLSEWSKFTPEERIALAVMPVLSEAELKSYNNHLSQLVEKYTNSKATTLTVDPNPGWANLQNIPDTLIEKARDLGLELTLDKWKSLTNLQRFALLKLYKPGHENKNFPKAIKEFNLL